MTSPWAIPVSTRTPEPSGNFSSRTVPGAGAKLLSASSALSRASTAWPNSGGQSPSREPPAATRICSLTRSMPGVDLEESEEFPIRLVEVLDGARTAVSGGADEFGRHGPKMVRLRLGQHR